MMKSRQSSKRKTVNANTIAEEKPPDYIFWTRVDVIEDSLLELRRDLKKDPKSIALVSKIQASLRAEREGIHISQRQDSQKTEEDRKTLEKEIISFKTALVSVYGEIDIPASMLQILICKQSKFAGLSHKEGYFSGNGIPFHEMRKHRQALMQKNLKEKGYFTKE